MDLFVIIWSKYALSKTNEEETTNLGNENNTCARKA